MPIVPEPEKLGARHIIDAYRPAKTYAQCACTRYTRPGDMVSVALTIAGDSGRVTKAEHDGSTAGTCVAEVFADTNFPRFKAEEQGVQISIRF